MMTQETMIFWIFLVALVGTVAIIITGLILTHLAAVEAARLDAKRVVVRESTCNCGPNEICSNCPRE